MKKTIQFGSVFGNYKWSAAAEIGDDLIDALLPLGALQVGQRSPSTAAEKEMAEYEKRPKGFNRTSISFDASKAETLAKHLRAMRVEIGRNEKDEPIYATLNADVEVTEYVPKEADVVMADERAAYARRGKAGELAELAEKVDYEGEVGDGTAENAPVEFLRAIRAWSKAQVAAI